MLSKAELLNSDEIIGFNNTFSLDSLEDPNFFGVQIARLQRKRESWTHARDVRYCQSPQPIGDVLGRLSALPASITTSEKKTNALQTWLTEQNHSPKVWVRSYFSRLQWSCSGWVRRGIGTSVRLLKKRASLSLCNLTVFHWNSGNKPILYFLEPVFF